MIVHNCDDLSNLRIRGGVASLINDFADFQEGIASLSITGDLTSTLSEIILDVSGVMPDWTKVTALTVPLKALDSIYNFEISIYAPDRDNRLRLFTSVSALNIWEVKTFSFPGDFEVLGLPDLSNITMILFGFRNDATGKTWKIDAVEVIVPEHMLSVNTTPITGIEFILGGQNMKTPWSGILAEGTYVVTVPYEATVANGLYHFVGWEDGSTDLARPIDLLSDMTIEATYEYVGPAPPGPVICPAAVIATCVYGPSLELNVLRRFRDTFMARNGFGCFLAKTYYRIGKYVATWLKDKTYTKRVLKGYLDLLIRVIKQGVMEWVK